MRLSCQTTVAITVPSRKRAHYGMSAHPPIWVQFLRRSNVYSNIRPCVAALENAIQMAGL